MSEGTIAEVLAGEATWAMRHGESVRRDAVADLSYIRARHRSPRANGWRWGVTNAKTRDLILRLMHVRRGHLESDRRHGRLTAARAEELRDLLAAIDELETAEEKERRALFDLAPVVPCDEPDDVEPLL